MQNTLAALITAAAKLMPTKKTLREANLLPKERKFISGEGWRWIETEPSWFQGVTLEAHAAGCITATVHTVVDKHIAYVSVPQFASATVTKSFRVTVHADTLLALVKTYAKTDKFDLSVIEGRLEMRVGNSTSRLNTIENDVYYDVIYAEAMKPASLSVGFMAIEATGKGGAF
jgi:hypothetical protein